MSTVKVTIAVDDPQGLHFEDLEVTVATGSTYTAVPRTLLTRLGVPIVRSLPTETAAGRVLSMALRKWATGVLTSSKKVLANRPA